MTPITNYISQKSDIQYKQVNSRHLPQGFGVLKHKSFLEQIASAVSAGSSNESLEFKKRKRKYSSHKKIKDTEDERVDLLGKVRRLEYVLCLHS